jgi:Domain of unknown function (DUF4157)
VYAFARKQEPKQSTRSASPDMCGRGFLGQSREAGTTPHLQRTIESHAGQGLIQTHRESLETSLSSTAGTRFSHDFSRMALLSAMHTVQAKLRVNRPGDKYEQEADRVAEAVMRMPDPGIQAAPIHRQAEEEAENHTQAKALYNSAGFVLKPQSGEDKEDVLQTKQVTDHTPEVTPHMGAVIAAMQGGGQPLPLSERAFFEPRFNYDFSQIRIHAGSRAARAARAVKARAFTLGRNVVFGTQEYSPKTVSGRRLLAHELTHVVQQNHDSHAHRSVTADSLQNNRQNNLDDHSNLFTGDKGTIQRQNIIGPILSYINVDIADVNAPNTPKGTQRIPPRVDTGVDVNATGPGLYFSSVTLSIEGQGGGNGTALINGSNTYDLSESETVRLRGVDQTNIGSAGNLKLVAHRGRDKLAESNRFSVAAFPAEMGFKYAATLSPLIDSGIKYWGVLYELTIESDSGQNQRNDLDETLVSEEVVVDKKEGMFVNSVGRVSGFQPSTTRKLDQNATGQVDAAGMKRLINSAGVTKNKYVAHQFFKFACNRTGIAASNKSPVVPISGFKITRTTKKDASNKYYIVTKKEGLEIKDKNVAAGVVDKPVEIDAEIKD